MALKRYLITPTVTAGLYAANAVVGGRLQFYGIALNPGIHLYTIVVSDRAAQNVDYVLTFFDAVPTAIADTAAITTLADADANKIIYEKIIDAATYRRTYTANSIHRVNGLDVPLLSNETDGDIWCYLWTTGAPTYASTSDISVYFLYEPWSK